VLWEAVRSEELEPGQKRALLGQWDQILGLDLGKIRITEGMVLGDSIDASVQRSDQNIETLIRERQAARASRDFKRADAIRDELKGEGITLEDSAEGTRWRRG
jgi:cysteinyl-tRNA synthetase